MRRRVQAGLVVVVAAAAATFAAVGVGSAASSPRTSKPAKRAVTVLTPLRAASPLAHAAVTPFIPAGNGDRYLFLKIPGIAGSVDLPGPYLNQIEATGYSWGIATPGTARNVEDLSVEIISDQSGPPLQTAATSGQELPNVTLTAVAPNSGGTLVPVRRVQLTNAHIDSLQVSGGAGGNDISSVSFRYQQIESTYYESNGTTENSCYDVPSNASC